MLICGLRSFCGGRVCGMGCVGVQSNFCVQPNHSVEVVLCCAVVGVVTIVLHTSIHFRILKYN